MQLQSANLFTSLLGISETALKILGKGNTSGDAGTAEFSLD